MLTIDDAWADIEFLDRLVLQASPGQEAEVAEFLERRELAVAAIASRSEHLDDLEELAARNRRLTEKLLHWRRVAQVESAAIDQHLRYLHAHGGSGAAHGTVDLVA
jgi:hypothetical protein